MSTKKQRYRERIAEMCDRLSGGSSESGKQLRAINRRIDKGKDFSGTAEKDGSWRYWKEEDK